MVHCAEQSQQVQSGDFQARTEVGGNFQRRAMGHAPSIAHRSAQRKSFSGLEIPSAQKPDAGQASETIGR